MAEEFALEPSEPGTIPERVINELRVCRRTAVDYSAAFTDACKAAAEKHGLNPSALRRYVCALESDSLEEVERETADLEKLIG